MGTVMFRLWVSDNTTLFSNLHHHSKLQLLADMSLPMWLWTGEQVPKMCCWRFAIKHDCHLLMEVSKLTSSSCLQRPAPYADMHQPTLLAVPARLSHVDLHIRNAFGEASLSVFDWCFSVASLRNRCTVHYTLYIFETQCHVRSHS